MIHALKAIYLVVTAAIYCHDNLPPPGANAVSSKTDKIKIEHWHSFSIKIRFPILICAVYTVGIMIYLLEMLRGGNIGTFSVDSHLNIIKTWHLAALGIALIADALRKWSIVTLDRFFTYRLTIRTQHKLINTGPYRYLRHPSYTGLFINQIASCLILFHEGLWDIFAAYMSAATIWLIHADVPLISSMAVWFPFAPGSLWHGVFLGMPGGLWVTFAWGLFFGRFTHLRVVAEEAMLEEHFGQEWRDHAAKRWRYLPFVM